jgi:putative membrane protein
LIYKDLAETARIVRRPSLVSPTHDGGRSAGQGRNAVIRLWTIIAAIIGLALAVYLIVENNADEIAHAMLLVGWGLVPISLFHVVPLALSALSWRDLYPRKHTLGVGLMILFRWIRESINGLLPVGGVGGDFVVVRLSYLEGVPGAPAAAAMVVDLTLGVITQLVFVMVGLALLVTRSTAPTVLTIAWSVLAGLAIMMVAVAIFLKLQHRGMFEVSTRIAGGLLRSKRVAELTGRAASVDATVVEVYRDRPRMWRSGTIRMVGWMVGTGEIWLTLYFFGHPISLVDAFILESLSAGVRAVAFMVPGALGILEGSFVIFGPIFGLPPQTSLMISLAKRVRELSLGLPGLAVWHLIEGRLLLRQRRA